MSLPTLSVLLPNYNHATFVGTALSAILAQSVQPLEIVVVDDASTDDSVSVIESYARRHAHIRFYRNPVNRGVNATLNRALTLATGEYIYGAASDDEVLPGFFERSLKMLAEYPEAGVCCSYPSRMDAITGAVTQHVLDWSSRKRYFSPQEISEVMAGSAIAGHTAICRRDGLLEVGGWNQDLNWYSDWFALQVLAFRGGACFIPATLALFRSSLTSYYSTGVLKKDQQSQAVNRLLTRLESPAYADIAPHFQRSGVLGELGGEALRLLAARREHWNSTALGLLGDQLQQASRWLLRDRDSAVREGTAILLTQLKGRRWKPMAGLISALHDPDENVRAAVRQAIRHRLGPAGYLAGGVTGRALLAAARTAHRMKRAVGRQLRPPMSWLYRVINQRLYHRLDGLDGDLLRCAESFQQQQGRIGNRMHHLRESLRELAQAHEQTENTEPLARAA